MSDKSSSLDGFEQLADSFVASLRKGEHPSLAEYVDRYPEFAAEIADLFPALAEMEGLKSNPDNPAGSLLDHSMPRGPGAALPTQLGDYRILRLIGQGGMGVVYEARRESLSAHVALKVLHHRFRANDNFLRRFRNEARSAARLHHTNIVPVFDFGEHDGILYYVMQYIPGQGLDLVLKDVQRLRNTGKAASPDEEDTAAELTRSVAKGLLTGRFAAGSPPPGSTEPVASPGGTRVSEAAPPSDPSIIAAFGGASSGYEQTRYHREVARIGAQVADALEHAHSLGVLHRDIKPPNLLLDARGNPWITDFGLAKLLEEDGYITDTGDFPGTLRYMSPERLEGRSDRRCDIYALGLTLYEMIAIRPAFDGRDRVRLIHQILHEEPPPLRKLEPRVPRDLETIILKAMAKEPASRYATAGLMAEDLQRFLEDRPPKHARRSTVLERTYRSARRNPLAAGLGVAAATMLVTVLTVSIVSALVLKGTNTIVRQQVKDLEVAQKEVTKQLSRVQAAERERREELWGAKLAAARASRYSGQSGRRFEAVAALTEAAEIGRQLVHPPERFARLRNEAIAALALADIDITKTFGRWTDDLVSVHLSADFELYATCDTAGRCVVRRVEDDAEVCQLPSLERSRKVTFGGNRWLADIANEGQGGLKVWDLSGPAPSVKFQDGRAVAALDFRPDGRALAVLHADGSLATYDLPSGKKWTEFRMKSPLPEPGIRLHPSLPYAALTSRLSNVFEIIHLGSGSITIPQNPWEGVDTPGAWSGDGSKFALPIRDRGVTLYEFAGDPPTLQLSRSVECKIDALPQIALNWSGDRLFTRGERSHIVMTDLASGRALFETRAFHALPIEPPWIQIDVGQRYLFPGREDDPERRFGYWSVAEGRECRLLLPSLPALRGRYVGIDASGRLAMRCSVNLITLHDLHFGREVGSIPLHNSGGEAYACFDASGHLLTNTLEGSYRWPIRSDPTAPGTMVIGPPQRLRLPAGVHGSASSWDGKVIAQAVHRYGGASHVGGWILRTDTGDAAHNLFPGVGTIGLVSVSPDGKFVAFGGSPGPTLVYDSQSKRRVWTSQEIGGRCLFSPDGKWLATDADNGRLHVVGTWEPGPQLGHGYLECFSADSTTAVLSTGEEGYFRLVEVATGHELARFQDPDHSVEQVSFSPDGSTLVAWHKDGLRVWDLRLIRAGLDQMGLDWDAPALPPETKPAGPLTVKVIGAELLDPRLASSRVNRLVTLLITERGAERELGLADELIRSGRHDLGLIAYDFVVRRHPDLPHPRLHRGLERYRRGDWAAAVEDLRLAPREDLCCCTRPETRLRLAWANHELGRDSEAASVLSQEIESRARFSNGGVMAAFRLLLAEFHERDGKPDLATKDRGASAVSGARLAEAANELAWGWLMLPADWGLDDNERNVPAALLLARKAVDIDPNNPIFLNTLGIAQYRSGQHAEARATLRSSLARGKGTADAWDLFPLAMCYHMLGDDEVARECYQNGMSWRKDHANNLAGDPQELDALRAEAGRLLGMKPD